MNAIQNITNLPAIEFKRFVQKYLTEIGVEVVEEGFSVSTKKKVQAMILGFEEEYSRPNLNSQHLTATLNITVNLSSESEESKVSQAILKLMSINGKTKGLPTYKLFSITPSNSSIAYVTESSIGEVNGSITLQFSYLMSIKE